MVGDSYEQDIEPARNVGMRTLWVLRRPEKERGVLVKLLRGEQTPPDLLVEDLNQIDTLLKRKGL
jgi:FMN phosphatase YigB (HAD superfamily)